MKGGFRFMLGLVMCMAAAGADEKAPILAILAIAASGIALMALGVTAINKSKQD